MTQLNDKLEYAKRDSLAQITELEEKSESLLTRLNYLYGNHDLLSHNID